MKYKVSVDKTYYATGTIIIEADNEDDAIDLVDDQISAGDIDFSDIDWGEIIYETGFMQVTGDADEVGEE